MKTISSMLLVCILLFSIVSSSFADSDVMTYQKSDIQIDLSDMSGNIVYSMIYNIMSNPKLFLGKIIRIAGYYDVWEDPNTGAVYHSCLIPDASACCAQGMEFVWGGAHVYPQDYPEAGTGLLVTGRLESYMEGSNMYLHLLDSEVNWLMDD